MAVSLRDHFVADNINHSSTCKRQSKWQDCSRNTNSSKSYHGADDLYDSGEAGNKKDAKLRYTGDDER